MNELDAEILSDHNEQDQSFKDFKMGAVEGIDKNSPVVVYCSVGYRSEKIAEKLSEAGFKDVLNLYGGIFEWDNHGYPLNNDKGECNVIHGYSWTWSKWIDSSYKLKISF